MTRLKNARPEVPTRAESFSRMLELEKSLKMQRLQDSGPAPARVAPTNPSSSVQPNPASRARPFNSHLPPLSSHPLSNMVQSARRNAPALSISVPGRPSTVLEKRSDTLENQTRQRAQSVEPPRTKTVTFSDPESEDDLSDQSSICQSPSWEEYGRDKKKDKKRLVAERKKEQERQEKALKNSKQKRLSKLPPSGASEPKPLTFADRTLSAPELDKHPKLYDRNMNRSTTGHYPPDAMANHHNLLKQATEESAKPKSKGFLAGLRNAASAPRKRSSSRSSIDDNSSVKSGFLSSQTPPLRADSDFMNPRKPPSITSTQSTSTQSMSSQERRIYANRKSGNSFLSRLMGPSYLYATPSESIDVKHEPVEREIEPPKRSPGSSHLDFDHRYAVDERHAASLRAPQMDAYLARPEDTDSDYETLDVPDHRHRIQPASDHPVANESRRRPPTHGEHARYQLQEVVVPNTTRPTKSRDRPKDRVQDTHRGFPRLNQPKFSPEHQVAKVDGLLMETNSSDGENYASQYTDEVDRLSLSHSPHNDDEAAEDDQASINTHASTIRPISKGKERNPAETTKKAPASPLSPNASLIGRAITHNRVDAVLDENSEHTAKISRKDQPADGRHALGQASGTDKLADYFTFISESYAPPQLELRSPTGAKFRSSPKIEEDPEEDEEDSGRAWTLLSHQGAEGRDHTSEHKKTVPHESAAAAKSPASQVSPSMSAHRSDSDAISFERLGLSPAAAKVLEKADSTETSEDQPSRTISERSSESTSDDVLFSSAATTPNTSRPQSSRGPAPDAPKPSSSNLKPSKDERSSRQAHRAKAMESLESPLQSSFRSASSDSKDQDDAWTRTALPIDLDQEPTTVAFVRPEGIASTPSLLASPPSISITAHSREVDGGEPSPPLRQQLPPRAQSAIDLNATSFLPALKHQALRSKQNKATRSSVSLPSSPPAEAESEIPAVPRRSALKMSRNSSSNSQDSAGSQPTGAAYLQEARRSVPGHPTSSSRALRPALAGRSSMTTTSNSISPERKGEPMAKMLVECCSCKFFHDMPSRVYECMAKPDSVVEDKLLGVSAAITTMVKCPWCAHGMTTQCCAGYAAVVYLKEKLHGK